MKTNHFQNPKELPNELLAYYYGSLEAALEVYKRRFGCLPEVCWKLEGNDNIWRFELPEETE